MSKEQLHCHYSDLPSPIAYMRVTGDSIDYDGMGNQGRIPNIKEKKSFTFKKPQRNKKSIWKL